jgi:small-conductance mechanosensitive channel
MSLDYFIKKSRRLWVFVSAFILAIILTTVNLAYSQVKSQGSPVILGDETLFYIQAGIGSFSPEFRSQVISKRLKDLAKETEVNLDTLQIVDNESISTTDIRIGDRSLVTIVDVDAVAAGKSRKELADLYLQSIKESITRFRDSYSIQSISRGIAYTLIATIILVGSLIAIAKLMPRFYRYLRNWRDTRLPAFKLFGTEILSANRVFDLISEIIKVLRLTLFLVISYLYINLVLSFFPWTKGLSRILFSYVVKATDTLGSGLIAYLPNLFFLAIIYFFTSYTIKVIRFLFEEIEHGNIIFTGFYREWARPTYKLVQFLIFAFAATVAFPYLPGSGTPAFQGISLFLGLLISLGSSSVISNIFAGIILTYTRAFQIGDRVKITDTIGDVVDKTLFVTRICTIKNVVITIPNSSVLSSHVVNYSAATNDSATFPLILHTTITLGYDVPWRKVHETLKNAALATEHILVAPNPFVLQTSLDDFYVSYELNAYTDSPKTMAVIYSELHQNIQDKCNEADIEILSPHYRAMRDGNLTTIPASYLPSDYQAPAFRLTQLNPQSSSENRDNT